jgi:hypothetical protein
VKTHREPWGFVCLTITILSVAMYVMAAASARTATVWYVAPGGTGNGGISTPFGRIQHAIDQAQAGDTILIRPGTYAEQIGTVRGGSAGAPIVIQSSDGFGTVTVTATGRVLTVAHPGIVIAGLVLDGQFGFDDAIRVTTASDDFTLRDAEVRRSGGDLMDIQSPARVTIERVLLHHALNATGGRTDAHGISAGAVRDMLIRDVEIHTFSGDGIQVDPGRGAPGWDRVTIERALIWLQPLPADVAGFPAGSVPGENAIDTKANATLPRATMTIRDVEAYGFRAGFITNMAAFNIKENVDVVFDGVTVHDSEIAFRLRGPGSSGTNGAWVRVQNAVVHDVQYGVRYEDNLQNLRIWNSTFGAGISNTFFAAGVATTSMDVRNILVLGSLPSQASHPSNRAAQAADFVNAAGDDYRLSPTSAAADAGVVLPDVTMDRVGVMRPQGTGYDVGAFERVSSTADVTPPVVQPPAPVTVIASEATGARGLAVPALSAFLEAGTAIDAVDPAPARLTPLVGGAPASDLTLFPIGTTAVTFRFRDASLNVGTAVASVTVQAVAGAPASMITNGNVSAGLSGWQTFATPDLSYIALDTSGGVLQFYRVAPPPGTTNQAVVFQHTGVGVPAATALVAQFDLGNSSGVRKRISVLTLDSNFSDQSVCTFWLPANAPMRTYGIRTHTTTTWSNAAIYFYAATAGSAGGSYRVDNVSLRQDVASGPAQTDCLDPLAPAVAGGPSGPELIGNGTFAAGLASWTVFGQLTSQLSGGTFEFYRPVGLPPAGVILQPTLQPVSAGEIVTAQFDLGNSSAVRKRVTVLLHDLDFSDLAACTFWLEPGQALSTYQMRTFPTIAWTNATLSIYDAIVGPASWTRLDNVSLRRTPGVATAGTECIEPGAVGRLTEAASVRNRQVECLHDDPDHRPGPRCDARYATAHADAGRGRPARTTRHSDRGSDPSARQEGLRGVPLDVRPAGRARQAP